MSSHESDRFQDATAIFEATACECYRVIRERTETLFRRPAVIDVINRQGDELGGVRGLHAPWRIPEFDRPVAATEWTLRVGNQTLTCCVAVPVAEESAACLRLTGSSTPDWEPKSRKVFDLSIKLARGPATTTAAPSSGASEFDHGQS
jgi:hypothetical protein